MANSHPPICPCSAARLDRDILLCIPFGLILFNLIATLVGGTLRMRAPVLFAIGAISMISIGLAGELVQSLVGAGWHLHNTTAATAATHFALIGAAVLGGFAALYYWFPKMIGKTMGETLGRISFWTIVLGLLLGFVPLFLAGDDQGQVVDAYKYFDGADVTAYNVIATIGVLILFVGILLTILNAIFSRTNGPCISYYNRTHGDLRLASVLDREPERLHR